MQEIIHTPLTSHHTVWFWSELTDNLDSLSDQLGALVASDSNKDGLIPKPHGEVKRPSRGGYTLKLTLNWDQKYFHQVQVLEMFIYFPHLTKVCWQFQRL